MHYAGACLGTLLCNHLFSNNNDNRIDNALFTNRSTYNGNLLKREIESPEQRSSRLSATTAESTHDTAPRPVRARALHKARSFLDAGLAFRDAGSQQARYILTRGQQKRAAIAAGGAEQET